MCHYVEICFVAFCVVYFSMALSHQDLLNCCISILDGFDDEMYAVENHVFQFLSACEVVC